MSDPGSRLVYSTDGGRVSPPGLRDGRRSAPARPGLPTDPGDGIVRIHRGKPAKGGKPATLIVGLPGPDAALDSLLKRCKQSLGTGGSRDGRVLLVQGDHRDKLKALLESDGYKVKLAGG